MDVEIKLGGGVFNLRPTFGAMREIEARTKSSCATLYGLLARQELHIDEAALVVFYGMDAAGEKPTDYEAVGKRLFEERITTPHIRDSLARYFLELLYAPEEARKKFDGEWRENEEIIFPTSSQPPVLSDGDQEISSTSPPANSGPSSKRSGKKPKG